MGISIYLIPPATLQCTFSLAGKRGHAIEHAVIARQSADCRGNPLSPTGRKRERERAIIYSHPPPFNVLFPLREKGGMLSNMLSLRGSPQTAVAIRTPPEAQGMRKRYLSIPSHHPSKKLLPYGRSGSTNGAWDNNHTMFFRMSDDCRLSSSP